MDESNMSNISELGDGNAEDFDEYITPSKRPGDEGDAGRCSKKHSKSVYGKKRGFHENRHTQNKAKTPKVTPVSAKKVNRIKVERKNKNTEGYRLVDMELLSVLIKSFCCPNCHHKTLYIQEDETKKKRLASYLEVRCSYEKRNKYCLFSSNTYTSEGRKRRN